MEIFFLVLAVVALLAGLAGAVLPIPGPPLSFLGLVFLALSKFAIIPMRDLIVIGVITLIVTILDVMVPIWGVKKFGGSKWGAWGTVIGVMAGLFLPIPGGIFVGAFAGALLGELMGGMASGNALRAAFGSFLGFLAGIFMKVMLCLAMIGYAIYAVIFLR